VCVITIEDNYQSPLLLYWLVVTPQLIATLTREDVEQSEIVPYVV